MQPAALGWPPPPNNNATSETLTYSFERSEIFSPFSGTSLINIDTSTPSISLPISTIPSWSPVSAFTLSSSALVIYVKAIFPSSKNCNRSDAILFNSKFDFVLVCKTFLYTDETFTPLFNSHATNSNVSAVTTEYLNPPVSVIIPANILVPITFVISIWN